MNARGESDGPIVPLSPANKGGAEPHAESAEGRGPARRNTNQTDFDRTQSPDHRRSRGLHGVREAAAEPRISSRSLPGDAFLREDFTGFSYGFRPRRSQHQVVDASYVAITAKRGNWILDTDAEWFCDDTDRDWLVKFMEHSVETVQTSGITPDSKQEPYEGILHVRICAGGRRQRRSLPRSRSG